LGFAKFSLLDIDSDVEVLAKEATQQNQRYQLPFPRTSFPPNLHYRIQSTPVQFYVMLPTDRKFLSSTQQNLFVAAAKTATKKKKLFSEREIQAITISLTTPYQVNEPLGRSIKKIIHKYNLKSDRRVRYLTAEVTLHNRGGGQFDN